MAADFELGAAPAAATAAIGAPTGVGPFRPIKPPTPVAAPAVGAFSVLDLDALSNGNFIYTSQPPPSGIDVTKNPTQPTLNNIGNQTNFPKTYKFVATVLSQVSNGSVGQIHDGTQGDNSDPNHPGSPPTGSGTSGTGLGAADYGAYLLNLADRSALGVQTNKAVFPAFSVSMRTYAAHWNDNTLYPSGPNAGQPMYGAGACVNRLPWEEVPSSISTNTSRDYPDIPASALTHTLISAAGTGDLSARPSGAIPDGATGSSANITGRTITLDPVQVTMQVPVHQPANLEAWDNDQYLSGGVPNITPGQLNSGDHNFAEGYIEGSSAPQVGGGGTPLKIFVDIGRSGFQTNNAPYRELSVFSGVSVNMSTSIVEQTRDIGNVPHGLGVQTGAFAALGAFTPYNPNFSSFYLPMTIHNDGNTNLLNVHLDQKFVLNGNPVQSLLLRSDALDPLSAIPAFDATGINGPSSPLPATPFDVRSSLDTDLLPVSRNPGIVSGGYTDPYANAAVANLYPGLTVHKPRVSDGGPSTMTVPDVPNDNVPGGPYAMLTAETPLPQTIGTPTQATVAAPPYLSVAIPFGTPVGSYYQTLRMFEGMDLNGYPTASGGYSPLYPPQYGGAVGGLGTPGALTDVYAVGLHPATDPGTTLKAKVIEDRMTDGFTRGALPQIDALGAGSTGVSTPDFAPAAFRDPSSGKISLYWTSGRGAGGFGIYGANVNFASPAFMAAGSGQQWWSPVDVSALTTPGTNSGLTIAQDVSDPAHVYAFAVNVNAAPYRNTLYSYTVTPGTGVLSSPLPVTSDPAQVKYGVRGLYTKNGFASPTPSLWAFWTATTRGRTGVYYNSLGSNTAWVPASPAPSTVGLLPVPAGLTSVADPCPVLMTAPVIAPGGGFPTTGALSQSVIEVTYSGTGPDGNTDLYVSRYAPDATTASKLNLVSYPMVTEILAPADGWYQARDVAWSRTGALNLSVGGVNILYNGTTPLYSKAIFDKASGLLVLTGVSFTGAAGGPITVYVDGATGRVRFAGGVPTGEVRATFNPLARRLTTDPRADTAPITFLDPTYKDNDSTLRDYSANGQPAPLIRNRVPADRRWYIWRKSGAPGDAKSSTLYHKTQRLTMFLPSPIGLFIPDPQTTPTPTAPALRLSSVTINGTDVTNFVDVDYARGRIFFPISVSGILAEGQTATVVYSPASTVTQANPSGTSQTVTDVVQWQDEQRANDPDAPSATSVAGLASLHEYALPIDTIVNESNVSAFLDTDAYADVSGGSGATDAPHKVWLFWNSTRNGTADLYYETINPRFAAGP